MKIKIVIVDNDSGIRADLRGLLQLYNMFDIVAEFDDVNLANDYLYSTEVDAVFINMHVGDFRFSGDGSYLAFNLSDHCPDMIVVLYDQHDYNASFIFPMNCVDFFTLPFEPVTMQRVVKRIRYRYELLQFKRQSLHRSMMVKTTQGYQLIKLNNILFIERFNRKNRMVTTEGKEVILNGYTLDELTRILAPDGFYRCYQSYIVNLSKVSCVRADSTSKNHTLQFDGYAGEILLSRDKYTEIIDLLKRKYARISL